MKKQKTLIAILLIMVFAISMNVFGIDTYAASKKYTKTYNLKRNYKKTVKVKSKIKSIKSSNQKIVIVTKSGKKFTIRTKKKGTAIITVKCNNKKTYKYKVKVSNKKHTHTWVKATCTTAKTCSGCGETRGSKLEHDYKIVVQVNSGVEIIPDEDFCCHSGWYFDTYEELRAHMDIPNVHGMVYLNDGSGGVTSVPPDYDGPVAFYASCQGWANCAGDGEGERIEYEITQEVQFCKNCGVRGEATDIGERVILSHTIDD